MTPAIRRLGTRLFERLLHGVALMPDGQDFYQHARRVLKAARDAVHKPPFRSHDMRGIVRVAASYTVLGSFLPELLERFRATNPFIEFDLRDMARADIENAVLDGETDIGVVLLSNVEKLSRFGRQVLIRSRRQLWVAPSHPPAQWGEPSLDLAEGGALSGPAAALQQFLIHACST